MTSSSPFELHIRHRGDTLLLELEGEVDMSTAPRLAQALGAAAAPTRLVVVDLTAVGFLDSSGLNALVQAQRGLAARGIGLRLVSPGGQPIRRVLEIAHLTKSLHVVDSRDDALA